MFNLRCWLHFTTIQRHPSRLNQCSRGEYKAFESQPNQCNSKENKLGECSYYWQQDSLLVGCPLAHLASSCMRSALSRCDPLMILHILHEIEPTRMDIGKTTSVLGQIFIRPCTVIGFKQGPICKLDVTLSPTPND